MALSLANIGLPEFRTPHEVMTLFPSGATYALLGAFAVLFLILTLLWYRRIPAASSQTAEWFLTAGRNMKSGIVAASIVCTWTWAATVMVSSAKGYQHGIAGPYWYAAGATIPLLLFSVLAIYLKRRAPMAHTFGEFVRHRFGGPSHRLMVGLGLLTCTIVTAMVVLGGAYALRTLIGLDVRVAVLMVPLFFAFYSAIGGLRGSIVVEYVQMVVLMVIALGLTIWFWTSYGDLGIFERLHALPSRQGESYLAFASLSALLFGIVNTIGNLGTVFMDQTYWQRAIAAAPHSAGRSFLIGGLAWFAIPFGVATALGVGGLALGFAVPPPFTDIAPTTAAAVFGPLGAWLFLIMLFMAIISTGNAESVAVASLVATDIYKTYVRPQASDGDILRVARGATLAFAVLVGPLCLALHTLAINMEWLYMTMGIFVGAGVIPLALGLLTDRLTGRGAYWATLGGLVVGLVAWTTAAYQLEGAIAIETLGRLRPITVGNLAVILASALICGIDCARPHARFRFELLRDTIRSYLAPPTGADVARTSPDSPTRLSGREQRVIRWGIGLAALLELIVPGGLYLSGIQFGQELFAVWVILSLVWLLMAAGFLVLLPIKDHYEIEYPEWLGLGLPPVKQSGSAAMYDSIGNQLFLSFLTVVLTLGIGAVVSLVKLGSIEHLRETNERITTENALHEDMVYSLIPQVLDERSRGERDGLAASALAELVNRLAESPYTPALLHTMISSSEPREPIRYLSVGGSERVFIAGSIGKAYAGLRMANMSQMSQQQRQAIVLTLISLVGTLTIGLMLTIRTSAAITRPIQRLAEASRRFVSGEPSTPPVQVDAADEIGVLTEEFNAMAVRIREQVTALKAAEEEFRLIVSHVNDAIIYLDLAGNVRWANHQAVVLSGRSMEDMIGRSFMPVLAPESAVQVEARLAAIRRGESVPPLVEFAVLRSDDSSVWVEANFTSVLEDGKVVGRLLVARDIAERKHAEQLLREQTQLIETFFKNTLTCIVLLDRDFNFLRVNKAYARACHRDVSDFPGHNHFEFYPSEAKTIFEEVRASKVLCQVQARPFVFPDHPEWGVTYWDWTLVPILGKSGDVESFVFTLNDVTERKQAENALRESEERFDLAVRGANEGLWDGHPLPDEPWYSPRTPLWWSPRVREMLGFSQNEFPDVLGSWIALLHPEDKERVFAALAAHIEGKVPYEAEYRLRTKQGEYRWFRARGQAIWDHAGKLLRMAGNLDDITERKRTERALKESAAHHLAIMDSAMDAVITITPQGRIVEFNPAAEALFGYARGTVIGKEMVELIIPPSLRERHNIGMARYLATGATSILGKRIEITAMHADGTEFPIELTVTRIVLAGQTFFTAFIRDITARKRAEDERARLLKEVQDGHERLQHLSRRMLEVQEEERRRLARELHDQTGQSLTSLLIGLRMLEEMPTLAKAQTQAGDLRKIAARALDEVKRLAVGLRPALLDDLGLEAALKRLVKESAHAYRISMDVHFKCLINHRLPPPVETGLYRITQEALTNTGRHAAAKNASVLLTCSESSVKLIIEDDGRGFDVEKTLRLPGSSKHLGLLGMRERVALLNGTISVESTSGSGTTIYVQLPLEVRPS